MLITNGQLMMGWMHVSPFSDIDIDIAGEDISIVNIRELDTFSFDTNAPLTTRELGSMINFSGHADLKADTIVVNSQSYPMSGRIELNSEDIIVGDMISQPFYMNGLVRYDDKLVEITGIGTLTARFENNQLQSLIFFMEEPSERLTEVPEPITAMMIAFALIVRGIKRNLKNVYLYMR